MVICCRHCAMVQNKLQILMFAITVSVMNYHTNLSTQGIWKSAFFTASEIGTRESLCWATSLLIEAYPGLNDTESNAGLQLGPVFTEGWGSLYFFN
jgi:hypothetical protein